MMIFDSFFRKTRTDRPTRSYGAFLLCKVVDCFVKSWRVATRIHYMKSDVSSDISIAFSQYLNTEHGRNSVAIR